MWIGIEGLRALFRSLDGRGPATALTETIPSVLGMEARSTAIVAAIHAQPPAALARLAPVVVEAALAGDEAAGAIVAAVTAVAAVAHATAGRRARRVGAEERRAIGDAVEGRVRSQWPAAAIIEATSPEADAAALALRALTDAPVDAEFHARLCRLR